MLEIRLMGTFDIKDDGKAVVISSRAAQSLFAYLVLNAGTPYRREKLAGMFWPDTTDVKARAYLRHELWRIRKALSARSKVDYLLADDINISFNSSATYWLDVDALENVNETASIEELMDAVSVSHGELLPGFYDDWIIPEREHLRTVFEQKIRRLLELLENEMRWNEIVDWAERWISFGQAPEAAYQYLMIAYDAIGDRAKLASTYERCIQALRELGLDPSEETQALAFKQSSSLNIPVPLNSFIGRKKELKEVVALLSESRLVTLTGVGGVGKTRLAIQAVLEMLGLFPDGIWFFNLSYLTEPTHVPTALTNLLGIRAAANSHQSPMDLLKGYLHSRTVLLIFDNCEHLIEICAQLAEALLQFCPNLHILASSREPLRIAGEVSYRVPSLEVPESINESTANVLANTESVRLFIERAATLTPGFVISPHNVTIIAKICQRLGGIPLAIELAAARVNTLSVEQILDRLDDRFNLLTHGLRNTPARHQTLRATIEWSYDLLSEAERLLFKRLGVFVGGWTLEAAEAVCVGKDIRSVEILDLLSRLVDKSLVIVETPNYEDGYLTMESPRFRRLETIRQYAREKFMHSNEVKDVRTRHMKHFLRIAEQAEAALRGPAQSEWHARLNQERDNLRAALQWADQTSVEAGLLLSGRLYRFWEAHDFHEGKDWLSKFLEKPESFHYPGARAKALYVYGQILLSLQQSDAALAAAQESLGLYRALQDRPAEVDALLLLASLLTEPVEKLELNQEAFELAQLLGDVQRQVLALWQVGWLYQGKEAFRYWEKAIALARPLGDWRWLASSLSTLGFLQIMNGEIESAQPHLDESEALYWKHKMKTPPAHLLSAYSQLALIRSDFEKARTYLEQSARISIEFGRRQAYLWARARLGYVALREGNLGEASVCFSEVARSFQEDQYEISVVYALEGIASLFVMTDRPDHAVRLIGWADSTREKISDMRPALEQADMERNVATIIEKIGKIAFEESYNAGRLMTLDEAVSFALNELY